MQKKWIIVIGIFSCLLFLTAVSGKSANIKIWGKFVPDEKVKSSFEKCEIKADTSYYISGSDVYPTAILGLNKSFLLETTLWKKIDLTPEKLCGVVDDMKRRAMGFGQFQFGFALFDNKGNQIGIWYSLLTATTAIKIKEDKKVIIYQPDQDLYERFEDNRTFGKF
jgi:hypothetical protein